MSARMIEEAYSLAQAVRLSCGPTPELEEAIRLIEEAMEGKSVGLEEAALLLRAAADAARLDGCLDWYMLEQAADTLEHLG